MFKNLFPLIACAMIFIGCGEINKDTTLSSLRRDAFHEFWLSDIKEKSNFKDNIKKVVSEYVKDNSLKADLFELNNFTNCVIYNIWQKNPKQTLELPLKACTNELNNGELKKINYEDPSWILGQFDIVSGEHYIASKYIKDNLNDPKSYEFADANYKILNNGSQVLITTEYIAKNLLGGNTRNKTAILFSNHGEILAVY
ncbi:TPA: hypothetical protein R6C16_000339 [Campylobacter coli]|nr:hypothetical protein [Campylobacter coli]HED7977613.1 hypothetical protein [Campylobacter coli]